jgi:hypothetical protein
MKRSIAILTAIFFMTLCFSGQIKITDAKELIGKVISYTTVMSGGKIAFKDASRYRIEYNDEGTCWYNEGQYEIKNGAAVLKAETCIDCFIENKALPCEQTTGNALAVIEEDSTDLLYSKFMKVKSTSANASRPDALRYEFQDSKLPAGTKRKIEKIDVITMGQAAAKTKENVKIRMTPSVNGKAVKFSQYLYDADESMTDFVPAGVELTVIARTVAKEKVQTWNNYWYYVNVGMNFGVWMFGEFVEIK